jgi:hypothetical protein
MRTRCLALTFPLAVLLGIALLAVAQAQDQKKDAQPGGKKPADLGFPDLVGALKKSPGCLGVETAQTSSRKQVIFAWFKDRKAVLKWYYSDLHQEMMKRFFPTSEYPRPLRDVAEDAGPIMVVASITPAKKPQFEETPLPISQIAIELYQPLPGGAALGGRFAPEGVQVKGLRDYTPKKK